MTRHPPFDAEGAAAGRDVWSSERGERAVVAAGDAIDRLFTAMQRVRKQHVFGKGMGLAAPQIGIDHAAAA